MLSQWLMHYSEVGKYGSVKDILKKWATGHGQHAHYVKG